MQTDEFCRLTQGQKMSDCKCGWILLYFSWSFISFDDALHACLPLNNAPMYISFQIIYQSSQWHTHYVHNTIHKTLSSPAFSEMKTHLINFASSFNTAAFSLLELSEVQNRCTCSPDEASVSWMSFYFLPPWQNLTLLWGNVLLLSESIQPDTFGNADGMEERCSLPYVMHISCSNESAPYRKRPLKVMIQLLGFAVAIQPNIAL